MNDCVKIVILPTGKEIIVKKGINLQDVLFEEGVEFPCGGNGRCKGCRIRVISGVWAPSADDLRLLSAEEIKKGWRLACKGVASNDITIELPKWETAILGDESKFEFRPGEGLGVAVDLGTTTIVAQLLDLKTGNLLKVKSDLNRQAKYGADIMSRVQYALKGQGTQQLKKIINEQLWQIITGFFKDSPHNIGELKRVIVVGNTVMHHLFCGLSVEPLAYYPFESNTVGLQQLDPRELGWVLDQEKYQGLEVLFLPCIGGFVGSDILSGIIATQIHNEESYCAFIDLGTNGEIVIGNREQLLCSSTAAGPAFEGARISMGMRATGGAISSVKLENGELVCHIIGGGQPRGICGSGLVDAVAVSLQKGWIDFRGRITLDSRIRLCGDVYLSQGDVRELQLAKGAIAAGIQILAEQIGIELERINKVYLAGAFGNYINIESAKRIGLLPSVLRNIIPAGNTALLGAKMALFNVPTPEMHLGGLLKKVKHISLNTIPEFDTVFADNLLFPNP